MKVFISIKYHQDNKNKATIEGISSALEKSGLETCCIVRDIEHWGAVKLNAQNLMRLTFDQIDSSDAVVIDLTEKGVGLGIEAGYAAAKGKPVVTIAKRGADISATLQGISQKIYLYDKFDELIHLFSSLT
jgi:nucleoside 2-deoxyribosyltransferase